MEPPKDQNSGDQEINRKRSRNSHEFQVPARRFPSPENIVDQSTDDDDFLALSLSLYPATSAAAAGNGKSRRLSPVRQEQQKQPPTGPPPSPLPPQPLPMQFQSFLQQPATSPPLPLQPPPPPPSLQPIYPGCMPPMPIAHPGPDPSAQPGCSSRPTRQRRNPPPEPREGRANEIEPPFPWATTQRATVHSLDYLVSNQILKIRGEVHCKKCDRRYEMEYDLREKFMEVGTFIAQKRDEWFDRAPIDEWMNPILPSCRLCDGENCARPVIPDSKDEINWLFLLLGQLLGCCTLDQLKYFCKHTKNHRTGAKNRVLYLTYLGLCKQLDPNGPFDR